MIIKSIGIVGVQLTQSLKVFTEEKRKYQDWEVEPDFIMDLVDQKHILTINVEVMRTLGKQHATIKVSTLFELELGSNQVIPATDPEFLEYASFQQIAIAHARSLFIRETRGTKYADQILPMDSLSHALQKVKLAFANSDRSN